MYLFLNFCKRQRYTWICLLGILILHNSCKKSADKPDYPVGSNENINNWMLDSLKRYYYWSDALPAKPRLDRAPLEFFAAIRNPSDRFSYIELPGDLSTISPTSRGQYGFDYTVIEEKNTGLV